MNIAMILAGGSGTRMGLETPKQFIEIDEKPLIVYTMESFQNNKNIDIIVMVCRTDYKSRLENWINKYNIDKVKYIAENGESRQESVENGIKCIESLCSDDDILLIHDGARPLISRKIIDNNIEETKKYGAVNTVIPCTDTLIRSLSSTTSDEVKDRSEYFLCQTPQSFKFKLIKEAHEFAKANKAVAATDDCQLVTAMGHKVYLVNGDKLNFKVTTKDDLMILKAILRNL